MARRARGRRLLLTARQLAALRELAVLPGPREQHEAMLRLHGRIQTGLVAVGAVAYVDGFYGVTVDGLREARASA